MCITNLSFTKKIAILVEMDQNRENRQKMFEMLRKSSYENDNCNSFIENGFVIIDEGYNSHEFVLFQKGEDHNGYSGDGGSYFILHKIGNKNPNYNSNKIVNIPLYIAGGGNGACNASRYKVNGIDGLCLTSENRNNYGGYI